MMEQSPVLLVAIPLMTALAAPALSLLSKRLSLFIIKLSLFFNLILSLLMLRRIVLSGELHYLLGNWGPAGGIEFVIDAMSGIMITVSCVMAFLVTVYTQDFFGSGSDEGEHRSLFYVLFLLMVTGVTGVAAAGDIFTMYVFLEITSISAYGLVALGGPRAVLAAFRYLIFGTVAATFYLIGIGFLFAMTGTLNMADLSRILPGMAHSPPIILSAVMILLALGIKSALVPLHTWLPDAHTEGPTPAVAYLATAMLKVFVYATFRFLFTIYGGFSNPISAQALSVLGVLAAVGIVGGSVMAIAQKDFRRMLAYSTIAQVSYIPLGLAIGTPAAIAGAALQIVSHSMTKGCLFMIKGAMHRNLHTTKISDLGGMWKKLPLCTAALIVSALSMIGLPPTSGFFVKWQLVSAAALSGQHVFIAVLIVSSLLNAVYFFRVLEYAIFKPSADKETQPARSEGDEKAQASFAPSLSEGRKGKMELPWRMLMPISAMALFVLLSGFGSGWLIENILSQINIPGGVF